MADESDKIIIYLNDAVVATISLTVPVAVIGRLPEHVIHLNDSRVSRNHAELRRSEQGVLLTDLGSGNGTYIGSEKLLPNQPRLIQSGTEFVIDPYRLVYQSALHVSEQTDEPAEVEPAHPVAPPVNQPAEPTLQQPPIVVAASPPEVPRFVVPAPLAPRIPAYAETSRYMRFLPAIFQETDFFNRFLLIFQSIWEPLEERTDHIALYFDPHTCPVSFLPWLASWFDLNIDSQWPEARRRHVLSEATELYRWRGTQYGLMRMIEVCTGLTPEITDLAPQRPFVFRIRLTIPAGIAIDRDLVEYLVSTHKPAHAGYILELL